jgi:hypothetical protein
MATTAELAAHGVKAPLLVASAYMLLVSAEYKNWGTSPAGRLIVVGAPMPAKELAGENVVTVPSVLATKARVACEFKAA